MNVRPYIDEAIAAYPKCVTPEMVSSACSAIRISPAQFCDQFAKKVADDYQKGDLSWLDADTAMNALSGFFFLHLRDAPFPDYAFGVFLAFDAGETVEAPEHALVTKEELTILHEKKPNQSPEPTAPSGRGSS